MNFRTLTHLTLALLSIGLVLSGCKNDEDDGGGGGGSGTTAPTAVADSYDSAGNAVLTVAAASGVLANDTGTSPTVTAFDAVSTNSGTVNVAADGSFDYTPATGFRGATDTFTYTAENSKGTSVGTVTINLSSFIWYIDNSGPNGSGTEASPFNSIANFNTTASDMAGDTIYLFTGSGDYTSAGITLLNNQQLIGEGAALTAGSTTLRPAGTRPTVAPGSTAVTLGADNTVTGIDFGNTGNGATFNGTSVGDLQVSDVSIGPATGAAIDIDGSTSAASITLDSITITTSNADALSLVNFAGTFSVTGATAVTNAGGEAIYIDQAAATASITLGSVTITNCGGRGVQISGSAAGSTITLGDVSVANPTLSGIFVATSVASSSIVLGNVTVNGRNDRGLRLLSNAGTVQFGTVDIGGLTSGTAYGVDVNSCDDLTIGNVTIADSGTDAINLTGPAASGTNTFGDITVTSAGDSAIDAGSIDGAIVMGNLNLASSGQVTLTLNGTNGTGSFTATSVNTTAGPTAFTVNGNNTYDFGNVTAHDEVKFNGGSGMTVTINDLSITTPDAGLLLNSGGGSDTLNLTGTANITVPLNAGGRALVIDSWRGTDGTNPGFIFNDIMGDASNSQPNVEIFGLQDDFTANSITVVRSNNIAMQVTGCGAVTVSVATTTLGTAANPVGTGLDLASSPTATFSFGNLSIDAQNGGIIVDNIGTLEFPGTPGAIDGGSGEAVRISNCGGTTWNFGDLSTVGSTVNDTAALHLVSCTADVVVGAINADTFSGTGCAGVLLDSCSGDITFSGTVDATGLTGAGSFGVVFDTCSGAIAFNDAVTISNVTGQGFAVDNGTPSIATGASGSITLSNVTGGGMRFSGMTGTVSLGAAVIITGLDSNVEAAVLIENGACNFTSTAGGSITVGAISGTDGSGLSFKNSTADVNLAGDVSVTNPLFRAVSIEDMAGRNITFSGQLDIDTTTTGQAGIGVNTSAGVTVTLGDCVFQMGTDYAAVDIPAGSTGANLTIASDISTGGIFYPTVGGNATAISAIEAGVISISGTATNPFTIDNVGLGTTDAGGPYDGPHGVLAFDCTSLSVDHVDFTDIGETTTTGYECGINVRNTSTATASSSVSVTNCTFTENVDGPGIAMFMQAAGNPTITVSSNTFGSQTSPRAEYDVVIEFDGTVGGVSGDVTLSSNVITAHGSGVGGFSIVADNGTGSAATPFKARVGTSGNGNTITDRAGIPVQIDVLNGSYAQALVRDNMFTATSTPTAGALVVNTNHGTGQAGVAHVTIDGNTFNGFDNVGTAPVILTIDGASTTSESYIDIANNAFANCNAAQFGVEVNNRSNSATAGEADVTVRGNDFTSTAGLEFAEATPSASRTDMLIYDNTNLAAMQLDRGTTGDQLRIADVLSSSVTSASDAQMQSVLLNGSGNNNSVSGSITFVGTANADIVPASAVTAPAVP